MYKLKLLLLTVLPLFVSCGKEGFDFSGGDLQMGDKEGYVQFNVEANDFSYSETKSGESAVPTPNVDDFTFEIFNSKGVKIKKELYGNIKETPIRLNAGNFTAKAYYGDSTATGWDVVYLAGKKEFTVQGQSKTPVSIECKPSNVKVSIVWGENIKVDYKDYSVRVYREKYSGELNFSKDETRSGYIPAGDISMDIYLKDESGKERCYSPKSIACAENDAITFTIDTKEVAKEEVVITFQKDDSTDDKSITVEIPAFMVAKENPSFTTEGFGESGNVEFFEGDISNPVRIIIDAPAFIESCILKINSPFVTATLPSEIDLLNIDESVKSVLKSYGLVWDSQMQDKRYATIDLTNFAKALRVKGADVTSESTKISVSVVDKRAQESGEKSFTLVAKKPSLALQSIPDYDMWATKCYVNLETNVSNAELFRFEYVVNNVGTTVNATLVESTDTYKRYKLNGLNPSTGYSIRANYNGGLYYTNLVGGTTEAATQLVNGDMESWSSSSKKTYGLQHSVYVYYPKNEVSGTGYWGTRNTLTTEGLENGSNTAGSNLVTEYRWNSCTIPTDDAVQGSRAAQLRTMALYTNGVSLNGVGFFKNNVNEVVSNNHKVYAGYLYTGSNNVTSTNVRPDDCGYSHASRPASFGFYFKYKPFNGDKFKVRAVLYNEKKEAITKEVVFECGDNQSAYVKKDLKFEYIKMNSKAKYLFIMFQSGTNESWEYVKYEDGDYDGTPWSHDTFVGSTLNIDNIVLYY